MTLLDRIRTGVANAFSVSTNQVRNPFNEAFLWGGRYTRYNDENSTYVNEGYNVNPIVYSVVNQQATKTASIPFSIKKIKEKEGYRKLKAFEGVTGGNLAPNQKAIHSMMLKQAFTDESIPMPLERPNVNQTWTEFLALYKTFMKLTGNVFIYMLYPSEGVNAGQPMQVYMLPSHLMKIEVKENAKLLTAENPIKQYSLYYGQNFVNFSAEEVIHIKYPNPNYDENGEHLYGQSPLRAALRNIQSSNIALDHNIKTLKSGGAFGFIYAKGQVLDPDQANEIKSRLVEMSKSDADISNIAGVSAELGFTKLSLNTDELKPFDFLSFDEKQICNVLGWDDKLLNNDASATYDNLNQTRKRMITDNIMPDLKLLSEALNKEFFPRFKDYQGVCIEFDYSQLPEMQTDIEQMSNWLNNCLDRGVVTRNEYRSAIGYDKIESDEMEELTTTNDILTLKEAVDSTFNLTKPNDVE